MRTPGSDWPPRSGQWSSPDSTAVRTHACGGSWSEPGPGSRRAARRRRARRPTAEQAAPILTWGPHGATSCAPLFLAGVGGSNVCRMTLQPRPDVEETWAPFTAARGGGFIGPLLSRAGHKCHSEWWAESHSSPSFNSLRSAADGKIRGLHLFSFLTNNTVSGKQMSYSVF